ncbi:hypothetical protein HDE_09464 [Halotydeus destructor]|nr:hypothetical protein HDE_09464 [Halotydeus destructor]
MGVSIFLGAILALSLTTVASGQDQSLQALLESLAARQYSQPSARYTNRRFNSPGPSSGYRSNLRFLSDSKATAPAPELPKIVTTPITASAPISQLAQAQAALSGSISAQASAPTQGPASVPASAQPTDQGSAQQPTYKLFIPDEAPEKLTAGNSTAEEATAVLKAAFPGFQPSGTNQYRFTPPGQSPPSAYLELAKSFSPPAFKTPFPWGWPLFPPSAGPAPSSPGQGQAPVPAQPSPTSESEPETKKVKKKAGMTKKSKKDKKAKKALKKEEKARKRAAKKQAAHDRKAQLAAQKQVGQLAGAKRRVNKKRAARKQAGKKLAPKPSGAQLGAEQADSVQGLGDDLQITLSNLP